MKLVIRIPCFDEAERLPSMPADLVAANRMLPIEARSRRLRAEIRQGRRQCGT